MPTPPQKPNVLLMMSDQHHKWIMGCAGDPWAHTPALDGLAARGARFENAYCSFPLCGPSRMSFMACRHPHETGCFTNTSQLSSDMPTFAHAFLAAGYETLLSGRMHFVGPDQRHGFERRLIGDVSPTAHIKGGWRLGEVLGSLVDTPGMGLPGLVKSGPGRTGYQAYDEAVCETTVQWLKQRPAAKAEERPFLLLVGFVLPHCPFVAPPEDFHRYHDLLTAENLPDPHLERLHPVHRRLRRAWGIETLPDAEVLLRVRAAYYGMVTFLDRQIGRVLDALETAGLAENTIVAYTSDHGEQLGEHGLWWKSTFYEGSAGVPLIVAEPGKRNAPREVTENVSLMDVGPTLLDLAGAGALPGASGRSFRPLLDGKFETWEDEVFAEHLAWGPPVAPQRMVRRGPWKFNYYHGLAPQLFNLEEDPGELHDRAEDPACRSVLGEMRARALRGWNPDILAAGLKTHLEEQKLIAHWVRHVRPPEPDPRWYDAPPRNEIEEIHA